MNFIIQPFNPENEIQHAYQTKGMRGIKQEGYMKGI